MVTDERERLKLFANVLKRWTPKDLPNDVFYIFTELESFDVNGNTDLWAEIKNVLKENKELLDKDLVNYLAVGRGDKKYWWWFYNES